jgi:hypothetical protein
MALTVALGVPRAAFAATPCTGGCQYALGPGGALYSINNDYVYNKDSKGNIVKLVMQTWCCTLIVLLSGQQARIITSRVLPIRPFCKRMATLWCIATTVSMVIVALLVIRFGLLARMGSQLIIC